MRVITSKSNSLLEDLKFWPARDQPRAGFFFGAETSSAASTAWRAQPSAEGCSRAFAFSAKTSQVNPRICVSGSCQAFRLRPALRQVSSRNCSRLNLCSTATCGSRSPRFPPWEISRPCFPISTVSGWSGSSGDNREISIHNSPSSSGRTGENRGSRRAASAAQRAMVAPSGSCASTTPMQPRKRPRA